jgi:hypothetical protein
MLEFSDLQWIYIVVVNLTVLIAGIGIGVALTFTAMARAREEWVRRRTAEELHKPWKHANGNVKPNTSPNFPEDSDTFTRKDDDVSNPT